MLLRSFAPIPLPIIDFLCCVDAITDKLKECSQKVRMEVLSHAQAPVNWWERYVLGMTHHASLLRRDIVTFSQEHACWFARTMVPDTTYHANPVFFDRLHNEPLAHLIYNEPRISRERIYSYTVSPQMLEYHWPAPMWILQASSLPVRVSIFRLEETFESYRFYLVEIFLPGLLHAVQCRN